MERKVDDDRAYKWGENFVISRFLVENFNRIIDLKDPNQQLAESKIYTDLLLSQLVGNKLLDQASQIIKIDIIPPKDDPEDYIPEDPMLKNIRERLVAKFGHEVIRRVNVSLSDGADF